MRKLVFVAFVRGLVGTALAAPAAAAAPAATPGVTETEILLGQPAAFSGASAGLGVEFWRGTEAMIRQINDAGGIHGRHLRLMLCDDGYSTTTAAECTYDLVKKRNAFMLVNSVGTPTIRRIAQLLDSWDTDHIVLFGNFTGAQIQREMPLVQHVFSIRASYHQETALHVKACLGAGLKAVGTFAQDDVFGQDGEEGVRLALKGQKLVITAETTYQKGATFDADFSAEVKKLRDAGVNCVSTTGSYQAVGAFIKAARAAGWEVPIYGVSFTGADQLLQLLVKAGGNLTANVFITQVVPPPDDTAYPLVAEYRAAMTKYGLTLPPAPLDQGGYVPSSPYSFGALEGYLDIKVLAEVLKRAGKDPTRLGFIAAAEKLKGLDVGLGKGNTVGFGPVTSNDNRYNHQALNAVWLTMIKNGKWVSK